MSQGAGDHGRGEAAQSHAWARAVALAGALAEHGVQALTLVSADATAQAVATRTLAARSTDLPAVLMSGDAGMRVVAESIGLEIEILATGVRVVRGEADAAQAIQASLAAAGFIEPTVG